MNKQTNKQKLSKQVQQGFSTTTSTLRAAIPPNASFTWAYRLTYLGLPEIGGGVWWCIWPGLHKYIRYHIGSKTAQSVTDCDDKNLRWHKVFWCFNLPYCPPHRESIHLHLQQRRWRWGRTRSNIMDSEEDMRAEKIYTSKYWAQDKMETGKTNDHRQDAYAQSTGTSTLTLIPRHEIPIPPNSTLRSNGAALERPTHGLFIPVRSHPP